MNCSTNGFQSYKQKESAVSPVAAEVAASEPRKTRDEDSSGMDLKDWISKPSDANKNSADILSTPNNPAAPPLEGSEGSTSSDQATDDTDTNTAESGDSSSSKSAGSGAASARASAAAARASQAALTRESAAAVVIEQ